MAFLLSDTVFSAAAQNFVKSVGSREWSSLIPAPGLALARECRPLHIVVKRKKKFFWNRVSHFPTQFTLSEILDEAEKGESNDGEIDVGETTREVVDFKRSLDFEMKGKVRASLEGSVAGVGIGGKEHITLSVNLGKIEKHSVDIQDLIKGTSDRKINVAHDFIQEVMSSKRNVLCIVLASLNLADGSQIVSQTMHKGFTKNKAAVSPQNQVEVDGAVSDDNTRSLKIPTDTPIAFRMAELSVRSDGRFHLKLLPGDFGGFEGGENSA